MSVPGTVLLIEQDHQLSSDVHSHLEMRGHIVVDADPSMSVHDVAVATHADVILLDADTQTSVPQRVVSEIRADERTRDLPIVLLGGHRDWLRREDITVIDTIDKPVSPRALITRIENGLELRRLRMELDAARRDGSIGYVDPVTNLNGSRRLHDELAQHCDVVSRYGGHLSIVLMDVDRMDLVNRHHGREGGDAVLRDIAERLHADKRASDVVGRWRADQFMAILPCTNLGGAAFFAERFRQLLCEVPVGLPGGGTAHVSASFGCAEGGDDIELVRAAEFAVGRAKQSGRNTVAGLPGEHPLHV